LLIYKYNKNKIMIIQINNDNNCNCEVVFLTPKNDNKLAKLYNFEAKFNTVALVNADDKLQLLVGLGDDSLSNKNLEKLITTISKTLNKNKIKSVFIPKIGKANFVKVASKVFISCDYQIQKPHLENEANSLSEVVFASGENISDSDIELGKKIADGINLCKDLADKPSNICTPGYLANISKKMADELGLECDILEENDMRKLGMNSLLSVSKGSVQLPKLITLTYKGDGNSQPTVLVGKGVTFDSGGISLKPGSGMDEMKYDMGGAASVLGTMRAIAQIRPKLNLTVIIPAVENMPNGNASKPGDVVKSMSGQTIEILNTDAEGRLILCDALTYAKKFNPKTVIDVATLTGAVIVALGKHHSGIMGNNQELIDSLITSGKVANDTLWQLPLGEAGGEFDEMLKSNFADMANIGGREAGSITAGCFLARFTKDYNWAHLDIAGTAWHSGANKGATGRPVSLLCENLLHNVEILSTPKTTELNSDTTELSAEVESDDKKDKGLMSKLSGLFKKSKDKKTDNKQKLEETTD
jgi:leucyl aminopeptidase